VCKHYGKKEKRRLGTLWKSKETHSPRDNPAENYDFLCFLSATVLLRILADETSSNQPTTPI